MSIQGLTSVTFPERPEFSKCLAEAFPPTAVSEIVKQLAAGTFDRKDVDRFAKSRELSATSIVDCGKIQFYNWVSTR